MKKPRGRKPKVPDPKKAKPPDKAQRNFTDPDSRIMKDGATKSFEQCYNAQAAVDEEHQVIVGARITQATNDKEELEPMVEEMESGSGPLPERLTADAGYYSEDNVKLLENSDIEGFVAVERIKHGESPPPIRGRPPKDMSVRDRMRRKLMTKRGRDVYKKRKEVVEPVFGQIKEARGLRRFLLRGYDNVSAEWDLWCLTHNLLKLHRFGDLPAV